MNKEGFLTIFRKANYASPSILGHSAIKQMFYYMLDFTNEGSKISLVDESGKLIEYIPDYKLYQGIDFEILRTLEDIKNTKLYAISWGGDDKRFSLQNQYRLLYALLKSDKLVDCNMQPITVSDETAEIVLRIDENDNECSPKLLARTTDKPLQEFRLLSDSWAILGLTLHPIAPLGYNYLSIAFFEEKFPKSLLEQYLSVFYSYVDNVSLVYEGYTLEKSDVPMASTPTIQIEKVDGDMALYLKLTDTMAGISTDFVREYGLTWHAQISMEKHITLRRIVHSDGQDQQKQLLKTIQSYAPNRKAVKEIYSNNGEFIIPQDTASLFLLNALPGLVQKYHIVGADQLKQYKIKAVKPKMKFNFESGIDFLEGSATINLDGEEFSLRKFLNQYAQQRYITLNDGNRALIDESYIKRVERIFKKSGRGKSERVKVSFFDLPDIEDLMQEQLQGEAFTTHRKFYEGLNQLSSQRMKFGNVNATLRNYQKEGVKWMNYMYENKMGACLADDMGLGKTLQTITMLTRVYPKVTTPSLLIMPRSLLFNWQDELHKFAPQLTYYIYYGNNRDIKEACKHQLVLTTYALIRNDIEDFMHRRFHYIILDESQNIKNLSSQATQAVFLLRGEHRLAISGTPIENNLSELYSMFRFLNPTMFGSIDEFNKQYTYPIQRDGDKEVTESLRRKIFPFMLRRLKKDVVKDLPDRMEQTLYIEMDDEHKRFYEERRQYYHTVVHDTIAKQGIEKSQMVMFQALSELRRIASVPESLSDGNISSPKLQLLAEQIEELVAGGHKIVIFFNFIAGIELIGERLTEMGIDYTTMTGSTRDRRSVVERFQNDPECRAMLMTLKTGGVGLNLTVADTVYIVEPWWNKAAEEQAINRLHRIGQKAKVMCYSLITRDTIEEKIRILQQQKKDLADSLITGDASIAKHLSEDDIRFILE